jgi:hypothetical protein
VGGVPKRANVRDTESARRQHDHCIGSYVWKYVWVSTGVIDERGG